MPSSLPKHYNPALLVLFVIGSQLDRDKGMTASEIWAAVREDVRFGRDLPLWEWYIDMQDRSIHDWLHDTLSVLAELGLVEVDQSSGESSEVPRWSVGGSWIPPEPPFDGGGGRGDGPISDRSDDDGDGGGGLQETLGHPVLFALPKRDFEELVRGLFDEIPK